jgi:uncharacterized protein YbjT (DUF2867 family)
MDKRPGLVIAGATGYVGRNMMSLCEGLVPFVRITRRRPTRRASHTMYFDEVHSATLPTQIDPRTSAILHLAGCSRESHDGAIIDGNVRTTETLLSAAKRWGIERIVFLSGFGIPSVSQSVFFRAKSLAENIIRGSGISYAVLRCSYILGGNDELVPGIRQSAAAGSVPIPGDGSYRMNPVSIYDVAAVLFALALRDRHVIGTHDFLGEAVTFGKLVDDIKMRVNPSASTYMEPVQNLVRSAMLDPSPVMSLSQVGILLSDLCGERTEALCGVRPVGYDELLSLLDYGNGCMVMSSAEWRTRYGY